MENKKKNRIGRANPELARGQHMHRGQVFTDRKKEAKKRACRGRG